MIASIRTERPGDAAAIRAVTAEAFAGTPLSDGSEPRIVDALRADGDLALSLVATLQDGAIAGHVAFSPVHIDGAERWYGLGPVSVRPAWQGRGIGGELIEAGLAALRQRGAGGVVVVGDPRYYARFGFARDARLAYPHPGGEYLQRLLLAGEAPAGAVHYARAFAN